MSSLVGFILGSIEVLVFLLPIYALLQNLTTKRWDDLDEDYKKKWTTYWICVSIIYGVVSPMVVSIFGESLSQAATFTRVVSVFFLYSPFTFWINQVYFFLFEAEEKNPVVERIRYKARKTLSLIGLVE